MTNTRLESGTFTGFVMKRSLTTKTEGDLETHYRLGFIRNEQDTWFRKRTQGTAC